MDARWIWPIITITDTVILDGWTTLFEPDEPGWVHNAYRNGSPPDNARSFDWEEEQPMSISAIRS
jgi:hypothetical protein